MRPAPGGLGGGSRAQRAGPPVAERAVARLLGAAAEDARDWAAGRSPWWRLALLAYLAWAFIHHLADPLYGSFLFAGVTLGVHELGHVVMGWAPVFLAILAGSAAQVLAPLAVGVGFVRQRDHFAVSVAALWLSFSLFNLATYIGDARSQELPLVSVGGGDAEHDWGYLLDATGLLAADHALAALTRVAAFAVGLCALGWGSWVAGLMIARRRESS